MPTTYVPILKCKLGEQKALAQLESDVQEKIKPLLEIPYSSATTKRPINEIFHSFWQDKPFFFYFMPEWYDENMEQYSHFMSKEGTILINQTVGTPVIDLSSTDYIEDWNELTKNGIAIRLRNNELGEITTILNPLFESGKIARNNTDLILDLQHISGDDLFKTASVLKAVFSELNHAPEFNSIIIASTSFPKPTPAMENSKIYQFERIENEIHKLAQKLADEYSFHYIFSDYGITEIENIAFVLGMSPNFKIKYSSMKNYLYIKSYSLKRGGLDIQNVRKLAKLLVDSIDFSGSDFSWGDNCIYQLAEGVSLSPGNLTTWVSYSMNHHLTLITKNL